MVIHRDEPLLSTEEVAILIRAAGTAPSMHNTQPWRFEVSGLVVDVTLDEERALPAEDPAGRLIRIGLGAAAFNLRVAAAMLGHETTFVTDPDPDRPDIAVRLFLDSRQSPLPPLAGLYGELRRRHTFRGPMTDAPVPAKVLDEITASARCEGADLHWLDAGTVHRLLGILWDADELDLHAEDRLAERNRWVGGERTADGVPGVATGPRPAGLAAVRNLTAGFDDRTRGSSVFEHRPTIAVLTTRTDSFASWIGAGMALEHALLTATSYDLAASFLNQALEHVETRARVTQLVGHSTRPQMIIRFGHPAEPGTETPRQSWQKTLTEWS